MISKNYILGGRFFIDILATIPFDTLAALFWVGSDFLELLSLLKLIRILRLSKIIMLMRTKEDVKLSIKFLQFILFLLMYINFIGCFWHMLISMEEHWEPPIMLESSYYTGGIFKQYSYAMYASVALLVGIEIMPQTFEELVYCSVVVLLGAMITAVLFGEMAVIMDNLNRSASRFNDVMNRVNTTMKNLKLPSKLQSQILDYLISTQTTYAQEGEYQNFKEKIPPTYLAEVNKVLFDTVIDTTPVFSSYKVLTRVLISKTDNMFVKPENSIITQNSDSDCMFFLLRGVVEVLVEDFNGTVKRHRILRPGDFFGEIGILFDCRRTATVRAIEYSTVAKVKKSVFLALIDDNEEIRDELKMRVAAYYNDPLTRSLDKVLKRIPYLRNLSDFQYIHVLHSLVRETYTRDTVLVNVGESVKRVFILVEGTVAVQFQAHGVHSHYQINKVEAEDESVPKLAGSTLLEAAELRATDPIFDIFITELNGLSIFCATQALIKGPVPIRITTKTPCTILVLPTEKIEGISRNIVGVLKANLCILKNRHLENVPGTDELLRRAPILDSVQLDLPLHEKLKTKARMKFKHSVLKVIMKNREKKSSGALSFPAVIRRLMSIVKTEGITWKELKFKIENGYFPTEEIELAKILHSKSSNSSVTQQMAESALKGQVLLGEVSNRLHYVWQYLEDMKEDNAQLQCEIEEYRALYNYLVGVLGFA